MQKECEVHSAKRAGSGGILHALRAAPRALIAHHPSLITSLVALAFLLACDLLLFRNALVDGQVYSRSDTVIFYFPIAAGLIDVLREGRLLLWTPYIFGGFPLFADGEAGMLYPPNLLAYLLMPEQDAFIWLRIVRYFLAAAFTYAYLRVLRLNGFAATTGALSFAFGSFMVTQMHHTNVGNTAVWLPLTLCMIELAVRNVRRWRWFYATAAGATVGIQALGIHVQPLLMSGLFLAVYIPFRVMLCPVAWPQMKGVRKRLANLFHRTALAILLLGIIPAIALGVAATQVISLAELGFHSFRGSGVNYSFATAFSMPIHNLINLVFPYFFRYTNQFYWSLWSEWETTLYAGIAPLALASIAVLFVRNRLVLFYTVAATASVLLAFGDFSPYPLYDQVRQLPGFSTLRVPGRFGMLVTFSIAVLAAFGADWLCRAVRPLDVEPPRGWWARISRVVGINGFAVYLAGLLIAMAGVVWWLVSLRMWIEREPWAVKRVVEESYLSLRNAKPWLTSDMVLSFLNYSLDPTNEKTSTALALMLAVFLLLFCWFAFRRIWRVWAALLVILVAVDMLLFATDFHPTIHIDQLSSPNAATQWLMAQNGDGMLRVYTPPEVRKTEANKLLPFQVADISGYSSLETARHQAYMSAMGEHDKTLLDLYNVRFVILPRRFAALPSHESTAYYPDRPLANGPRTNPGAHVTFYVNPPVDTDEIRFISNLRGATEILQDADVADIVVVDTEGERITLKVKAGRDTAEWAYDRPDVTPNMGHRRAQVADKLWVTDSDGPRYQANLYIGKLKLDKPRTVARVEFHYTHPKGKVRLYGMMLWRNPGTAHQILSRNKFIPRYEDDEVLILENPSRLPRTFLVPTARLLGREKIVDTMVHGDFDPEKVVLLETRNRSRSIPVPLPISASISDSGVADPDVVQDWLRGNADTHPGTAEILSYQPTELVVRTNSDRNAVLFLADTWYPGWKALVDGREQRVYRANFLFRSVLVPRGEHEVRFVFEPESFALGRDISVFTVSSLLIFWAILLPGPHIYRRARWAMRPASESDRGGKEPSDPRT